MKRLASIVFLLASACSSVQPRTEVVLRVVADPGVVSEIDRLHVVVRAGGNRNQDSLAIRSDRTFPESGDLTFPFEIGLVPADGDTARVFEVTVTGQRRDAAHTDFITERVVSGYVAGTTVEIVLRLEDPCRDLPACDPGNTCHLAMCVDAYVDPSSLHVYVPDTIDGGTSMDGNPSIDGGATDTSVDGGTEVAFDVGPIAPPRPIRPLSGSAYTAVTPIFDWELTSETDGAHLQVCADRACTSVLEDRMVDGSTVISNGDYHGRVVFWRIAGRWHGSTSPTFGPVWQLELGRTPMAMFSTTRDTSWMTSLDVNGDGRADLAVGAPGLSVAGHVDIYLGSTSGLPATPSTTLADPGASALDFFGASVVSAGDLDGDGFGDLAVAAPASAPNVGHVYVYFGSESGVASVPDVTLTDSDPNGRFGSSLAAVNDTSGRGYADLAVGASGQNSGTGSVSIFYGGSTFSTTPGVVLNGTDVGGAFGSAVAGGDWDGDTFGDLAVGARNASGGGKVYVYRGSTTGIDRPGVTTLLAPDGAGSNFGRSVACAGDVNADGRAELVVGADGVASSAGRAYVYRGQAPFAPVPMTTLTSASGMGSQFGWTVASAGDVDGDAFDDVLVGSQGSTVGDACLYRGTMSGLDGTPIHVAAAGGGFSSFVSSVAGMGDVNGDMLADFAVGTSSASANTGSVRYWYGSMTNVGVDASGQLGGTTASGRSGASLARLMPIRLQDGPMWCCPGDEASVSGS